MRHKKAYLFFMIIIALLLYVQTVPSTGVEAVEPNRQADLDEKTWNPLIAGSVNSRPIALIVDSKEMKLRDEQLYMDQDKNLMLPVTAITNSFNCAVNLYDRNRLVVEKNAVELEFLLNGDIMYRNQNEVPVTTSMVEQNGSYYVPLQQVADGLNYSYQWDIEDNQALLVNQKPDEPSIPYTYDYRDKGRKPAVIDQGKYGTCWAFASLTALASSILPEENLQFSPDHMSLKNSFCTDQNSGGEYTMAMAYLSSWQGPVLEEDDPYGDGYSPDGLKAVKHVQEIQIIEGKDFQRIKEAVYKYGGVQSSLYTSLTGSASRSMYYNQKKYAYCYIGTEKPNHDIVIIGWDDNYPKENFNTELEGDGAFICQNSWGEEFGDDGVFYVSYYDTNIGMHNVVYTSVEEPDNYDHLYQSDLCGWVGQVGYGSDTAYFANVYQAEGAERLQAVGFYATGKDTEYEISVVRDFQGPDSLNQREYIQSGYISNAGFYTIPLDAPADLVPGERFAVVVKIKTPNSVHPIAIEYPADDVTMDVDLTDGEGYISLYGSTWDSLEENYQCNFCLKAYTDNME
ncbi:lectin like domain-containing protein [Diplocloster agilis]|uniref:Cell surface protein n=1 Tax=Diplocloster agilis TaxID=2850323 RepID=A0A949K0W1_9FIRM|nr:lectin like domain-containing protein [Diplocloster agilis]MBU9738863.1 cell surface protein [Diplocloster agilis]